MSPHNASFHDRHHNTNGIYAMRIITIYLIFVSLCSIQNVQGQTTEKSFNFYFPQVLNDCFACTNFPNIGLPPWAKHQARQGEVLASVQLPNITEGDRIISQAYCCRFTFGTNAQIDLTNIIRVDVTVARQAFYVVNTRGAFDNWLWFGIYDKTDREMIFGQWQRNASQIGDSRIPNQYSEESRRAFNYSIPNWQNMGSVILGYQVASEEPNAYVELINGTITVVYSTDAIVLTDETKILIGVLVGVGGPVAGTAIFLVVFFKVKQKKSSKEKKRLENEKKDLEKQLKYSELPDDISRPNKATPYKAIEPIGNNDVELSIQPKPNIVAMDLQDRFNIPFKDLKFEREIGAPGGYGKVFVGEWQVTQVAIKVSNAATSFEEFKKEAQLMINIRPHPNVLQVLGVSSDGFTPMIVMEYCAAGSLDAILFNKNKDISPQLQLKLIFGIARGLLHLHKNNIVHRDLAARNVLLTSDFQPKISDFGMSRIVEASMREGTTRTTIGPVKWMAPESIRDRTYSIKSDVWTFGIVLSEIINRSEPHSDSQNVIDVAMQIRDHNKTPRLIEGAPEYVKQIVSKCWAPNPEDRPEIEEIIRELYEYQKDYGL